LGIDDVRFANDHPVADKQMVALQANSGRR